MAATTYDSLIPYIALEVDGAPHPVISAAINLAARELCFRSSCWNAWESIPLIAGTNEYTITASVGSMARNVRFVGIDNKEVLPDTEDNIYQNQPGILNEVGTPRRFYVKNDMKLVVLPTPATADGGKIMKVKTAFIPALDGTAVPAEFVDRFSETLIAGAKAKMMEMPGKAWTNPQLAQLHKATFETGIDKARIEVEHGYTKADLTVTKRGFK